MVHEQAVDAVIGVKRNEAIGQDSLFGLSSTTTRRSGPRSRCPSPPANGTSTIKLAFEREMLGLYVSSHPLDGAEALLERSRDYSIADILDGAGGTGSVRIAGIITSVTKKVTKQGDVWALVGLEDHEAAIEVACFPATTSSTARSWSPTPSSSVTGQDPQVGDERRQQSRCPSAPSKIEILDVTAAQERRAPAGHPQHPRGQDHSSCHRELKRILQAHPGEGPGPHEPDQARQTRRTRLNLTKFTIEPTSSFMGDIKHLLGSAAIAL